jgi:hypothetical protein
VTAAEPFPLGDAIPVVFGAGQPQFEPLPALLYPDGQVLIEWTFTDEERALIARGENLRHWIAKPLHLICSSCGHADPCYFHPVKLEVTSERIA